MQTELLDPIKGQSHRGESALRACAECAVRVFVRGYLGMLVRPRLAAAIDVEPRADVSKEP